MNVYFCDVCGVRVTDVDLHSGHGMRRRNDVICAACIDLGHGKEWVEHHAQKQAPAMAGAAVAGGGANGHVSPPPSRPVDLVRDRLRTVDEDEPASPVAPVVVPRRAAPPTETPEFDDTAQVPVLHQELSSAAAGFAALTPPQAEKKQATDEDDIEELPPPKLDDSGPSPVLAVASPFAQSEEKEKEKEKEKPKARSEEPALKLVEQAPLAVEEDGDAEKSETAVSAHKIDEGDRPESKRSAPARSKTSSSRVSKAAKSAKGGSSRTGRKPKNNSQQMMLISIAGMAAIIIIGSIVIVSSKGGTHTDGGKIPTNFSTAVRDAVSKTKSAQKAAVGSRNLPKLEEAHSDYLEVRQAVSAYERVAKEKGLSDDAIGDSVAGYGVMDVGSVDRAVRDEIEVVHSQGH